MSMINFILSWVEYEKKFYILGTRTDNVGPDLNLDHLTLWVFLEEFLKNNFEKSQQMKLKWSMKNYSACKELREANQFPKEDIELKN